MRRKEQIGTVYRQYRYFPFSKVEKLDENKINR